MSPNQRPEAASRFIERFALSFEKEGFPRIAGRILAYLILYPGPFAGDELADALAVSRASVSTNTRALEAVGMIDRVTIQGDRRIHHELAGDPWRPTMEAAADRLRQRSRIVSEALGEFDPAMAEARERLESTNHFQRVILEGLEGMLAQWKRVIER